jgi:ABC-type transport system involved in multi-copper enzyme maturation permease subunit
MSLPPCGGGIRHLNPTAIPHQGPAMFGVLVNEQDPLSFKDLPIQLMNWVQSVGGVAAFGLFIWVILWQLGVFRKATADVPPWMRIAFRLGLAAMVLVYVPGILVLLFDGWTAFNTWSGGAAPSSALENRVKFFRQYRDISLAAGGALALLTAGLPFFRNLADLRWRRIWALSKLSFKEAIRRRVLYAFAGLLLIYLFGSWFIPHKPEDQVRSYVQVIYWGMGPVLLFAAAIVAAFSIPADIRQQTIHTIVTKPVERFEIVLGRFLGFTALMTLVLVAMSSVSLIYVLRGVDPDAAAESLKAREPLYGELHFENTVGTSEHGNNVGREWEYRSYITAPQAISDNAQAAIWELPAVPASVADRKQVRCEYSFDIYRTTKGTENRGISCNFTFEAAGHKGTIEEFGKRLEAERAKSQKPLVDIENELAEELGVYQKLSQEVTDNHTQSFTVPGGLLRAAGRAPADSKDKALQVRVSCNDRTQYVGMAKFDFYLRADDPEGGNDEARFALNFFKGTVGLWLRLVLIIGLAVALSTYFSGVIAMLVTLMIYIGGIFQDFIVQVAEGNNAGGGPLEALYRLTRNENIAAPIEKTATVKLFETSDVIYRWVIARVLEVIPDVNRFDLSNYVAEGFNVPADQLVLSLLLLIGYLLPWAVLAFYLIKWREIASPT